MADVPLVLVGNKNDEEAGPREVSYATGETLQVEHFYILFSYFPVSIQNCFLAELVSLSSMDLLCFIFVHYLIFYILVTIFPLKKWEWWKLFDI